MRTCFECVYYSTTVATADEFYIDFNFHRGPYPHCSALNKTVGMNSAQNCSHFKSKYNEYQSSTTKTPSKNSSSDGFIGAICCGAIILFVIISVILGNY